MKLTKRNIISFIISAVMLITVFCVLCIPSSAAENITVNLDNSATVTLKDTDGDGAYDIGTANELLAFAKHVNSGGNTVNGELTDDIDLSGVENWTPIGNSSKLYQGKFDGNGHSITNFKMTVSKAGEWGLFGYVSGGGTAGKSIIKNFSLEGTVKTSLTSNVDAKYGAIGYADGLSEIYGIHSSVKLVSEDSYQKKYFGGVIGMVGNVTVDGCSFDGTLELGSNAIDCVGGIIAYAYNGKNVSINNCGFYGTISSSYESGNLGGIIGYYNGENAKALSITNTLSVGTLPLGRNAFIGTLRNYGTTSAGTNNYYISTLEEGNANIITTSVTEVQLKLGAVVFLLNGSSEGAWGQSIGTDNYPILGGERVYLSYEKCYSIEKTYNNANSTDTKPPHKFDKEGFCEYGCYEEGTVVTEANYKTLGLSENHIGYYALGNAGQLYWFSRLVNDGYGANPQNSAANAVLLNSIDLNPGYVFLSDGTVTKNGEAVLNGWRWWTAIGLGSEKRYEGIFDGNGKSVNGIYIFVLEEPKYYLGFFGYSEGTVKNLTVNNSYVFGDCRVGSIVGENSGTVTNCVNNATVIGDVDVGGIVGYNSGIITYSVNNGKVYSDSSSYIGGIAGDNGTSAVISDCYNTGDVNGIDEDVGGVVGVNYNEVIRCYNIGNVSGKNKTGGVAGSNKGEITDCYNLGKVTGTDNYVGGVVGYNSSKINYSYNLGEVVGKNYTGGIVGYNSSVSSDTPEINASYYLFGSAKNFEGELQGGVSNKNGILNDIVGAFEAKTRESFASGEIACLLGSAWGQKLGTEAYPHLAGAAVYKAANTNCLGESNGSYTYSNDESIKGESNVHERNAYGYCELCQVRITGTSITLAQDLTMNYSVKIMDEALRAELERITMRFTMNGRTVTVKLDEGKLDTDNNYVFSFEGIAPQNMTDNIVAQLLLGDAVIASMDEYSIKANAEAILELYGEDEKLVNLVTDLLCYGAAAQSYKSYKLDSLATEGLESSTSTLLPTESESVRNLVTHAQGNAKFTAATVWFDNVNRIGVKLSTVEGVTLKVNGETVELTGTTYYTDGIFATDFGKSYTFELYEGETLIETLTYSVNSYTFSMIGKTEEDGVTPTKMAELAKALYRYGVSAVSYKNAN